MNDIAALRIVFMGTPDFAVPSLTKLHKSPHQIAAVVTVPDKVQGRGRKIRPSAIKQTAESLKLPILQPDNIRSPDFLQQLVDIKPDLIVVVAFQILPESIFTLPRLGSFNLHASLLPRYRGAAPIHWALLNGDEETGVSTFFLKRRVDTGNIILQAKTAILPEDNLHTLYNKLCLLGADLVETTVTQIAGGLISEKTQDNSLATPAPKVDSTTQRLDFNQSVEQCHNRIRAFAPKPGAYTTRKGTRFKLLKAEKSDLGGKPGVIIDVSSDSFTIACGTGSLIVSHIQPESKKAMSVDAYLKGHSIEIGEQLG